MSQRIEPDAVPDCCHDAWKKLGIWDNEDLPEKFVCPECGNYMLPIPWQAETGITGLHLEGCTYEWYTADEERVM